MISASLKEKLQILKTSGKIPHVILVTGLYNQETKLGKLTEVAQSLEDETVSEPKGSLVILDSEVSGSIKVDEVRDLLKSISLRNWDVKSGRYVLIPRAELLTVQSSNALLKSLEESAEGTYFILGVPSQRSVLRTVLSRSFVLKEEQDEISVNKETNIFQEAFFEKRYDLFLKTARPDLRGEWQDFSVKVKDVFVERVYAGDLDKTEWHRLFDFMEEVDQKIEANMDTKWLASSIERFGFNG